MAERAIVSGLVSRSNQAGPEQVAMNEGHVVFPMTNEDLFAIRSTVLYLALGCGTKAKAWPIVGVCRI